MDKSILSLKRIVESTNNINSCIKSLNLSIDSCFLCFIALIEDGILNYDFLNDYTYLFKISNYLERVYQKLSLKKQNEYKVIIYKIRKIIKKQIQNFASKDRSIFENICVNLNSIINNVIMDNSLPKLEREVVSDEYIITIDELDSHVLDDALSVKKLPNGNLLLKVYIADPLALYPYKSEIIKNAKSRIENIYCEDKVLPIIDDEISMSKLSLIAGKEVYAKTFCYEFDKYGNIVNYYFLNNIIRVNKRHSYDSINELYQNGGNTQEEDLMLSYYNDIVNYLRRMFGKSNYDYFTVKKDFDEDVKISSFSEKLVSYSMILTGHMVAKHMDSLGLPYCYRCNKVESIDGSLREILSPEELVRLREILSKSFYSRVNYGHQKLNIQQYSHITSPLRRFIDNLNMEVLNICYFKTPVDKDIYYLEDEIDKTCQFINEHSSTEDENIIKKIIK